MQAIVTTGIFYNLEYNVIYTIYCAVAREEQETTRSILQAPVTADWFQMTKTRRK